MAELKPCPFCGNEEIECVVRHGSVRIGCTKCLAGIRRFIPYSADNYVDEACIVKNITVGIWNTRTKESEVE